MLNRHRQILVFAFLFLVFFMRGQAFKAIYPKAPKKPVINDYFGTKVTDDYQWMENLQDSNLTAWIASQEEITGQYFKKTEFYDDLKSNYKENYQYYYDDGNSGQSRRDKLEFDLSVNEKKNYYTRYSPTLYVKYKYDTRWEKFLDPDDLKKHKNDKVTITDYYVSNDEKTILIEVTHSGSDLSEVVIAHVFSKKIINTIEAVKFFNPIWYKDGFFYLKSPESKLKNDLFSKNQLPNLHFHKINNKSSKDIDMYLDSVITYGIINDSIIILNQKKIMFNKGFNVWSSTRFVFSGDSLRSDLKPFLVYRNNKRYRVLMSKLTNNYAYAVTDLYKSNGMLVRYDLTKINSCDTIINEYAEVLDGVFYRKDALYGFYYKDFSYRMAYFDSLNKVKGITDFSRYSYVEGPYDINENEAVYYERSLANASVKGKFNFKTNTSSFIYEATYPYKRGEYVTEKIDIPADDGVKIPVLLFYKKGTNLNSVNPMLIKPYGGFGLITAPHYDYANILWIESGGIYVMPAIRGGGERGRNWHFAGANENKSRCIQDLVNVSEYFVNKGMTIPDKLALIGESHGGMVVMAAANSKPNLFKVVIPVSGVYDMYKYQNYAVGNETVDEYDISSDSLGFISLQKYSPYHGIRKGFNYPSVLMIIGDHDDRVTPFDSYKQVAKLQEITNSNNPIYLHIRENQGHSGAMNTNDYINEQVLYLTFLFKELNMKPVLPK